jgi:branched-subunit amino acid aminotransferase/4-amino-4-deoxychorismate lyase
MLTTIIEAAELGSAVRIEIDGREATADMLVGPATALFGHFTAMQVRDGRTRGVELHLRRLTEATTEVFGEQLDTDRVLAYARHALGDVRDASLRVYVYDNESGPSIMVTVRPPGDGPSIPQRLKSARHQRPFAHIKHLGGFAQTHLGRLARRDGFDDVVLVTDDGLISEAAVHNIGFFSRSGAGGGDGGVVWPDAPMLHGITMQLLEAVVPSRRTSVGIADISSYDGAFLCNSRGIAPVAAIDDVELPLATDRVKEIVDVYDAVPWESL